MTMIDNFPTIRGRLRKKSMLSKTTWFRVGGPADILFKPADTEDLSHFLKNTPQNIPITVIGAGSNVLVRDGGVEGVVIKLGSGFNHINQEKNMLIAGAACLDITVAQHALENSVEGLEFLSGIPGTIGGALRMNAGAYGREVKDTLIQATAVSRNGEIHILKNQDFEFSYRHCTVPEDWIFTEAIFSCTPGNQKEIAEKMAEIRNARETSQPTRARTGGSTFKNPDNAKAWELIDQAGCRGLRKGNAQVSEKHCNFLINLGDATSKDLEDLGEEVRAKVKEQSGVDLTWEIKRIGRTT